MQRKLSFLFLLILVVIIPACKKNSDPVRYAEDVSSNAQFQMANTLTEKCPGVYSGIAVDQSGNIWYSTIKPDTSIKVSPESNTFPSYTQIYMFDGKNHILKYDKIKNLSIEKLVFDCSGNLWLMGMKKVMKINNQNQLSELLSLDDSQGLFQTIEADQQNNIWVGGLSTGLYKYSNGQWSHFTTSNSPLKTNSMTKIHADRNNTIWIALWDLMGVQKIENNRWTSYQKINSDSYLRDIWDLKTDKNGNLWVGSGWINPAQTLLKFNGNEWEVSNPRNSSGIDIPGTIRLILSDANGSIWTVSEEDKNSVAVKTTLAVYNAQSWNVIENAADNKIIRDIKSFNNKLYLATYDNIYIIGI